MWARLKHKKNLHSYRNHLPDRDAFEYSEIENMNPSTTDLLIIDDSPPLFLPYILCIIGNLCIVYVLFTGISWLILLPLLLSLGGSLLYLYNATQYSIVYFEQMFLEYLRSSDMDESETYEIMQVKTMDITTYYEHIEKYFKEEYGLLSFEIIDSEDMDKTPTHFIAKLFIILRRMLPRMRNILDTDGQQIHLLAYYVWSKDPIYEKYYKYLNPIPLFGISLWCLFQPPYNSYFSYSPYTLSLFFCLLQICTFYLRELENRSTSGLQVQNKLIHREFSFIAHKTWIRGKMDKRCKAKEFVKRMLSRMRKKRRSTRSNNKKERPPPQPALTITAEAPTATATATVTATANIQPHPQLHEQSYAPPTRIPTLQPRTSIDNQFSADQRRTSERFLRSGLHGDSGLFNLQLGRSHDNKQHLGGDNLPNHSNKPNRARW